MTMTRGQQLLAHINVVREVRAELDRQDEKWGEQNHPDGTGPARRPLRRLTTAHAKRTGSPIEMSPYNATAEALQRDAKAANDADVSLKDVTWAGILLEEMFEALAEPEGSDELRTELIQTAAVCVQWVLAIDRRNA